MDNKDSHTFERILHELRQTNILLQQILTFLKLKDEQNGTK